MVAMIIACRTPAAAAQTQPATPPATQPATAAAEDGQWPMAAKNYASTRFSGLDQITSDNVKNLQVAWTFTTGTTRGHEAAPF
jgi:glucose dehydrogenase